MRSLTLARSLEGTFWNPMARLVMVVVVGGGISLLQLSSSGCSAELAIPQQQSPSIVSLPLIPHREQQRRRRRRASQVGLRGGRRRRRRTQVHVDALYQGYGTHYVDLWCGTPTAQRQTVIVDTGSGVTAFPCLGCHDCGGDGHHIDNFYNQSMSDSFQALTCSTCKRGQCSQSKDQCTIGMSYQEGSSWTAFEVTDVCYVGGPHDHPLGTSSSPLPAKHTKTNNRNSTDDDDDTATGNDDGGSGGSKHPEDVDPAHANGLSFATTFGCQTKLTGLFKTQLADGIMGMDNADTSFWYQMHKAGKIDSKQFSLCFSRQPTADRRGTEAGALTFGGADQRFHTSPMVFTSFPGPQGGFYGVHVRKIYLRSGGGGDSAKATDASLKVTQLDVSEDSLNRGSVIVDSGTTDTYFTNALESVFKKEWKNLVGQEFHHEPVVLTTEQLNNLPTILFQLVGAKDDNTAIDAQAPGLAGDLDPEHPLDVILAMPPSHYMEYDERDQNYVARFYPDEGGGSVLGANAIMGHDVLFDLENNRIGWAESHCDYAKLLQDANIPHVPPDQVPDTNPTNIKQEVPSDDTATDPHEKDTPKDDVPHKITKFVTSTCTSWTCRGSTVGAMVLVLVVVAVVVRRMRQPAVRRREYQLTSELELSAPTSNGTHAASDDELEDDFVQYRDHPKNKKSFDSDDDDDGIPDDDDDKNNTPSPRVIT